MTNLDIVSIEQPLWNTLQGNFMRATYYPITGAEVIDFEDRNTENLWGDHAQSTLLLLLIPYALLPRTETLMILLVISIGFGAVPMFNIAKRRFSSPWFGLLFSMGYLSVPVLQTNVAFDIHGTNFLPPLLLAAYDASERGNRRWLWFWILAAMGTREDMPFLVGWGIFWLAPVKHKQDETIMFGLGTMISLLYFLVVIPVIGGGGSPYIVRLFPAGTEITSYGIWSLFINPISWRDNLTKFLISNILLGSYARWGKPAT